MIYVNPDNFLGDPRIFTEERAREAWRACKDLVERTLSEATEPFNYYLVCGVQGSGKTRWVKENTASFVQPAIVFDAALSRARDRAGGVAQARRFSCRLICIWISCPLEVALAQNRAGAPIMSYPTRSSGLCSTPSNPQPWKRVSTKCSRSSPVRPSMKRTSVQVANEV